MSQPMLTWYQLGWPRELAAKRVVQAFRLLASSNAAPVIVEAMGVRDGVEHHLALPEPAAEMLVEQLRSALPALALRRLADRPDVRVDKAVELRLSSTGRPIEIRDAEPVCRALLTALSGVRTGETLVLQWQLVHALAPGIVRHYSKPEPTSLGDHLARAFGSGEPLDAESRGSLRVKRSLPGWRVVGRIGSQAATPARQRQLIQQVASGLRSAETPGVRFTLRPTNASNIAAVRRPWRVPMRLNAAELVAVSAWPVGDSRALPVSRQASRLLAPAKAVPSTGRTIGVAAFPGRERQVALSVRDSLRHLHLLGPTGVGKSTLLLRLIVQDMDAGRAVVVVEPKGDLINEVLARVPATRRRDIVLIDPTDSQAVVGINPLSNPGRSSELVADQLLSVFHHLYASSWGPRTSDILHASLLTLAQTPGMSLAALPLLLSDAAFRRRVVGTLNEPIVLQPFWQAFDAWSEAERTAATAPVLNKVRPLLVRPSLRAVLGQASPRFELRQLFRKRKILLVNLAKGLMGAEAAALLGSVIVAQVWQTALERTAIPAERRRPVFVFVDEFADYLNLPTDLADALAQARGLGVGLTLAHQHLGQLDSQMRSAVLTNARSRVVWQLADDDAKVFAGGDGTLEPEDFRSLGAYEAYAQLVAGDAVQPWLSLRTEPARPASSDPDGVRRLSRERYGMSLAAVDAELQRLRSVRGGDDLGPRPIGGER